MPDQNPGYSGSSPKAAETIHQGARVQCLLITDWQGRRSAAADYTMDVLGLTKVTVRLTTSEAIVITLVLLLIWFAGYMTGAGVTRIWEKTEVIYDCIFLPAPEDINRV
jgi:hypothetical protein